MKRTELLVMLPVLAAVGCLLLLPAYAAGGSTNGSGPVFVPLVKLGPMPFGTPGPSPTPTNTRASYPFTRAPISPQYIQNFTNNAGCQWMGIGGNVYDLEGNPVAPNGYRVHVWGWNVDARAPVGGAPAYDPSGWEQYLFDAPIVRDYFVQLETTAGVPVSEVYWVVSRANCNQNLILFFFLQNH